MQKLTWSRTSALENVPVKKSCLRSWRVKLGQAACPTLLCKTLLTNYRYVNELAEMKKTFIDPLLHPPSMISTPPQPDTPPGTSSFGVRRSGSLEHFPIACQLPEDLRVCLEVIENDLLESHVRLSEALKKRYDEQYPLVRSLADIFVRNVCYFVVVYR